MALNGQRIPDLPRGARIQARVLEVQSEGDLLVTYQEALFRVKNHTHHVFKIGDVLRLQVIATHPLEFKIFEIGAASLDRMI
jgi:hypothetical protein